MPEITSAKLLLHNTSGELLLLRRSLDDDHRPGTLDLPGGGIDGSETPLEAVVREARQEIGLDEDAYELNCQFDRTYLSKNLGRLVTKRFFVGRINTAATPITLSHEHTDYFWMHPAQASVAVGHIAQRQAIEYVYMPEIAVPAQRLPFSFSKQ